MSDPPQASATWQTKADLLAYGRAYLERRCDHWRWRHLYPAGADLSLLLLAYQELDRRILLERVGTSEARRRRALGRIIARMVRVDALARDRRLAYGLPEPEFTHSAAPAQLVERALLQVDPDLREPLAALLAQPGPPSDDSRGLEQFRQALVHGALASPEALVRLPPQWIAWVRSAPPRRRRHPVARFMLLKLPLQFIVVLLTLFNLAYIGAYHFFNDRTLGRFLTVTIGNILEGELEFGSVHWEGRMILDLLTGRPTHAVVEDVTVWEPFKSYGGDKKRIAAHADRIDATLVLHEIIPWNRLVIPRVFEIPWILHFGDVRILGPSSFEVRGYRDTDDRGISHDLIGLRDAFVLYNFPPNDDRGLSIAVDRAEGGQTHIDVDFRGRSNWRFVSDLQQIELALRFTAFDPRVPLPETLPLSYSLAGQGGRGLLSVADIEVPLTAVTHVAAAGGTEGVPMGDVAFDAELGAADSPVHVRGQLRRALARQLDPRTEPLPVGAQVQWGTDPLVFLDGASPDAQGLIAHLVAALDLPEGAVSGLASRIAARIAGPLSHPVYNLSAEGLSLDPLADPAWTLDDARIDVTLTEELAPGPWRHLYGGPRWVARFDTLAGLALEGDLALAQTPALAILRGTPTEPYILAGRLALDQVDPAQFAPDDPLVAAYGTGTASGEIGIDELVLGQVDSDKPLADGAPAPPMMGVWHAQLDILGLRIRRSHGPAQDGLPRDLTVTGQLETQRDGSIDFRDAAVSLGGARISVSGGLDPGLGRLHPTSVAIDITEGRRFAHALELPYVIDQAHAQMTLAGLLRSPEGEDGTLRLVTTPDLLYGPTEAKLALKNGVLHLRSDDARLLGGQGRIEVDAHLLTRRGFSRDPAVRATVSLAGVDLARLPLPELEGTADVEVELGDELGRPAPLSQLRGAGVATAPLLSYAETAYHGASLAFRWTAEELAIERLVLPLSQVANPSAPHPVTVETGRILAQGTLGLDRDPALDLSLRARGVPLDVITRLLDMDTPIHGQIGAGSHVEVTGTLSAPNVEGRVNLQGLTALGLSLGSGQVDFTSDDVPALAPLAAHREIRARGELSGKHSTAIATLDWSIDAVLALGKPTAEGPPVAAEVDVNVARLSLGSLLQIADAEVPGLDGALEGLSAHVLHCGNGPPLLSSCLTPATAKGLQLDLAVQRAWAQHRESDQATSTADPCTRARTLCTGSIAARLVGPTLVLQEPVQLHSIDGTQAQLTGQLDLSPAPPPLPTTTPRRCSVPRASTIPSSPDPSTLPMVLAGTLALEAFQSLLEPLGIRSASGKLELDLAVEGPLAAPVLRGRASHRAGGPPVELSLAALGFPLRFNELDLNLTEGWLLGQMDVSLFGETLEIGTPARPAGLGITGPCSGHFAATARGTLDSALLAHYLADTLEGLSGAVDLHHLRARGTLWPDVQLEGFGARIGFTEHSLTLQASEGLEPITLARGRADLRLCGDSDTCDAQLPASALVIDVGGTPDARDERIPAPLGANLGARGQAELQGRLALATDDGQPLRVELDGQLTGVNYRHFDGRGRPVAEAELSTSNLALRGAAPVMVTGDVTLSRGRYIKDAIKGTDLLTLIDAVEVSQSPPPDWLRNLSFDLQVATDDPFRVENNIATGVAAKAQVTVRGNVDEPEFHGRIEIDPGGTVDIPFVSGTFDLLRGQVDLRGSLGDARVDVVAQREEPIYIDAQPRALQLWLRGTLSGIGWSCFAEGDTSSKAQTARSCFEYLVLGTGDVQVSQADVRRFGGGGLAEARKPLQVVGHVAEIDLKERASEAAPRLGAYLPEVRLRLGQLGPEMQVETPRPWFDFGYGRLGLGWDYVRGYPGIFLRQSRQYNIRLQLLDHAILEFSRRIRSYVNQRVVFDPLTQRTLELRFDLHVPSRR